MTFEELSSLIIIAVTYDGTNNEIIDRVAILVFVHINVMFKLSLSNECIRGTVYKGFSKEIIVG